MQTLKLRQKSVLERTHLIYIQCKACESLKWNHSATNKMYKHINKTAELPTITSLWIALLVVSIKIYR